MPALKIPRYDDNCALCRVAKADKTGSHLAPNFLVHGAFSFDGKGGRFREIVTRDNLNTQSRWLFYGQEVSPEAISADRGRCLTDEELEGNINVLECDNLFWLSVFWRMGVGCMSIFLDGEDEFAMREILDRHITSAPESCGKGGGSAMPMVDVFMPEKFWKGKRGYSKTRKDIEKFVDMLEAQGYTDNDIRDNLRSRENE